MSPSIVRSAARLTAVAFVSFSLFIGCSNPISSSSEPSEDETILEATATTAPAMPIITPTPVDPTAVAAAANQTPGSSERPDTYVVAENDTLYGIAAQFEVDLAQLVEENNLSDPNDIYVGQELTIPTPE